MAVLRDLNELAKQVVQNFNDKFDAKDCRIPQSFKDNVKRLKSFSVVYNEYSVIIKGDGIRSKDSYVPNQCFYMASFFIEYSYELSRYKQKIMPWITNAGITTNELTAFFTHERDKGKEDIEKGEDRFIEILNSTGYDEEDRDYLIKFVTDYEWWSGSKTIERSDFFNSPVLSIMGLTASSNAAMALIVDHLTQHPEYNNLLLNQITNKHMDNNPLQQIFYGAPGTGKSHRIKEDEGVKRADEKNLVFRTTFHPDSDYSTFVGAYKPTIRPVDDKYKAVAGKDEEITYSFVPQAFLQAYIAAWDNQEENVYLIIEEINRGNCAQIFGDLFQLLDRDGDGYSEYPIMADRDLTKFLNGKDENDQEILANKDGIKDGKLCLPKNLYIWATMNTSDQSLFPIDSAFKRRWEWVYVPIDTKKETWYIKVGENHYSWTSFLDKVNDELLTDETAEDKHLGFYFCKATEKREGAENEPNVITAQTFVGKVLFYLWNDVFKVYGIPAKIGSSKDWPYRKFYQTNGEVDETRVTALMEKLGIKPDSVKADMPSDNEAEQE